MKNENTGTGLEDKVDRYLLGYMDAEERSAFESEMSSDAGLKEEVSVRSMVISAVQERARLRERLLGIESGIRRRRINRIFAPFSSVAAAVCIICGFFIHDRNVQNCLMLADSCLSGELVPPSRGGIDLDPVVKAIEEENFDEAHALIKQLREEPVPEFDLSTETGRGYHMQYQFDMQTVDYLEAITYIKEGKPGRAKRALKRISSSDTSYYNEEARGLLDKLQ